MTPAEHPCFFAQARFHYGRIHLSVTPRYNIRCDYCDRRYDRANESRSGVASEVISPEAVLDRVECALCLNSRLRAAGVMGPGESLANPATLETLCLIHARFPRLLLCLSTNGLVLSDALPELLDCGASTLTVTVSTRPVVRAGHAHRVVGGSADAGAMAAFLSAQQEDVAKAAEAELTVRINTVVIPGFNIGEVEEIARWATRVGAAVMNLMPLIPQAGSQDNEPPSWALLEVLHVKARVHILQPTHCR